MKEFIVWKKGAFPIWDNRLKTDKMYDKYDWRNRPRPKLVASRHEIVLRSDLFRVDITLKD